MTAAGTLEFVAARKRAKRKLSKIQTTIDQLRHFSSKSAGRKMIESARSTSRRFDLWKILTSLLTLYLTLSILLSVAFGVPDDANQGDVPGKPIPTEPQKDPNTPKEKTIDMGNGVIMEFILIPAGEFYMGSPSTEKGRENYEGPVHRVKISRPFYMCKYEVTQQQYYVVAKYKPSRFKQEDRPVENVSWDQAARFCRKLSEMNGGSYRLPTEAEWEYACRGGSQDMFYFGDDPTYSQIEQYAWYSENSDSATHPVGEKKPNSFGLYDMHGNVWEWCGDWYAANYYRHSKTVDPHGPYNGKSRVLRGGGWFRSARYCRSACRSSCEPVYIRNNVGFRVVLEVE